MICLGFVNATTYYISPTGNNASTGTSTGAWKTFAFAIPKLKAGDNLILLDGIYDATNRGYPNFTNVSGTAAQPITVKVQNERKAFIKGNGSVRPVVIQNSHYLILDGLRVEEGDIAGASGGSVVLLKSSDHITIRRFLLNKDNRYQNSDPCFLSPMRQHGRLSSFPSYAKVHFRNGFWSH